MKNISLDIDYLDLSMCFLHKPILLSTADKTRYAVDKSGPTYCPKSIIPSPILFHSITLVLVAEVYYYDRS